MEPGLGLGWESGTWSASYRVIAADFPLNRKAGGPERYSRQPVTEGFKLAGEALGGNLRLYLELDHPTRREVRAMFVF